MCCDGRGAGSSSYDGEHGGGLRLSGGSTGGSHARPPLAESSVQPGGRCGLRVIAAAGGVVLGFALFSALDAAADLLPESTGWVHEEAGLWAVALVTLAVACWQRQRASGAGLARP